MKTDLNSKSQINLLLNLVKHALSLTMTMPEYKTQLESKKQFERKDLHELLRTKAFKRDLLTHLYN